MKSLNSSVGFKCCIVTNSNFRDMNIEGEPFRCGDYLIDKEVHELISGVE